MTTTELATTIRTSTKDQLAALLPSLQAAKKAHMDAWKASQDAHAAYAALKEQYSALCKAAEEAKVAKKG